MVLAFPNMGNLTAILCAFMRDIGGAFVEPVPTSDRTVKLGAKYAPQDACMPMKLVLGNFIEAYENGADTALFFGGRGPCCFGYFAETFRLIFAQNAIPMRVVALEYNAQGVRDALQLLSAVNQKSLRYCASQISVGLKCAQALDRYEQAVYDKRAEISDPAEKDRLTAFAAETDRALFAAESLPALLACARRGTDALAAFRSDTTPQIHIGVVGDIYSVIDPFMNKNVQSLLADMGAYTRRSMTISGWLNDKLKKPPQERLRAADAFLPAHVGGFARETVGSAAQWARAGFDEIIEIYPLNCMPESVARTILPKVSATYETPILTVVLDEMSGEAGYLTRLEAFTQMMIRKKETEIEHAVFGH